MVFPDGGSDVGDDGFFSISISELFNELKNFFKNRRCKPRKFGMVPSDLELLKLFFWRICQLCPVLAVK